MKLVLSKIVILILALSWANAQEPPTGSISETGTDGKTGHAAYRLKPDYKEAYETFDLKGKPFSHIGVTVIPQTKQVELILSTIQKQQLLGKQKGDNAQFIIDGKNVEISKYKNIDLPGKRADGIYEGALFNIPYNDFEKLIKAKAAKFVCGEFVYQMTVENLKAFQYLRATIEKSSRATPQP